MFRIRIHLSPDPDPAIADPYSDPVRIQGIDDQKFEKIYSWKKNLILFFYQKLQFTYPWASLKLEKLTPSKGNIQHFKT